MDANAKVVPFKADEEAVRNERPFVPTFVARQLAAWMDAAHVERGISVVSGPWGIGKTTAIDQFAADHEYQCAVIKVEAGSRRGATPIVVMQLVLEAMAAIDGGKPRSSPGNSYWVIRRQLFQTMEDFVRRCWGDDEFSFTLIFDEAQYLSREAIEMLRFWNDGDRTTMPFPVGLVFVGNNEFALQDDGSGQSVLSGAVRSRALYIEALEYADVGDGDLAMFAKSRGVTDPAALATLIGYFSSPRVRRDLRNTERLLARIRLRAGDGPITADTVRSVINS